MRLIWTAAILGIYLLHQDLWFWSEAQPLVFGFLPVGLAYHGAYCIAAAGLMWALTRWAWPGHLEKLVKGEGTREKGQGQKAMTDKVFE